MRTEPCLVKGKGEATNLKPCTKEHAGHNTHWILCIHDIQGPAITERPHSSPLNSPAPNLPQENDGDAVLLH